MAQKPSELDLDFQMLSLGGPDYERVLRKFLADLPPEPKEQTAAVRLFMAEKIKEVLAAPRAPHKPKRWTFEWQARLFVFVQRRIWGDLQNTDRRQLAARRREAFEEAASRSFPFGKKSPTPEAVKKQYQNAKRALQQHEDGGLYLSIVFALQLEALHGSLGENTPEWLQENDPNSYRAASAWVWKELAATGRLLPPDV